MSRGSNRSRRRHYIEDKAVRDRRDLGLTRRDNRENRRVSRLGARTEAETMACTSDPEWLKAISDRADYEAPRTR